MATTKKTTKVVTPVDERETFVSLQKNFADSEQVAQEKLKTLHDLQETDMEIDKLLQLRGELPEEVAALESELDAQKAKYARAEQMIEGYNQNIEEARKNNVNIVISGHMSSDSLGVNLICDVWERHGIDVLPCSGFTRFSRN